MELSRLLMLEARVEMEDGRPANAREIMFDILALAGHVDNLEASNLVDHALVMLLRRDRARWLLEEALAANADTLDSESMRAFIAMPDLSADHVAHSIRGQWNIVTPLCLGRYSWI